MFFKTHKYFTRSGQFLVFDLVIKILGFQIVQTVVDVRVVHVGLPVLERSRAGGRRTAVAVVGHRRRAPSAHIVLRTVQIVLDLTVVERLVLVGRPDQRTRLFERIHRIVEMESI